MSRVQQWIADNADLVAVMRRCAHNRHQPGDSERLTQWVNDTVMRGFTAVEPRTQGGQKMGPGAADRDVDTIPCDQEGCEERLNSPRHLGVHKFHVHGIRGKHAKDAHKQTPRSVPLREGGPRVQEPTPIRKPQAAPEPKPIIPVAPLEPKPAAKADLPSGIVALLFEDITVADIVSVWGDEVRLTVVAGKGLAVMRKKATA